jgi:hypothetical protein
MSKATRASGQRRRIWASAMGIAGALALLLALALNVAQATDVPPTNQWMDLYSDHSAFAGVPIPAGSHIAVFDTQGIQCGQFEDKDKKLPAGWYGIMPCYGTGVDAEGPVTGEQLRFTVNGVVATPQLVTRNATPMPPGTSVTWTQTDWLQVDLSVSPRPPVTVTLASAQVRLDWQPAGADVAQYEVWRSTAPYFAPGDAGAERPGTVTPGSPSLSWSGGTSVGNPGLNYAYRVRSLNALSQTVGISQAVGEFDFALAP